MTVPENDHEMASELVDGADFRGLLHHFSEPVPSAPCLEDKFGWKAIENLANLKSKFEFPIMIATMVRSEGIPVRPLSHPFVPRGNPRTAPQDPIKIKKSVISLRLRP